MNPLTFFYNELIYRPLLNSLVLIYSFLPFADLGLAIVGLTVLVRLVLHPAVAHSFRSQQALVRLQPELKKIKDEFKSNQEEQAKRTMELYRKAGINPLSGCLPIIIQLPVLIGLYQLFWKGIGAIDPQLLYSFTPRLNSFNTHTFGILDLGQPGVLLALSAGLTQFLQSRYMPQPQPASGSGGEHDFSKIMRWQMTYFFPLIIVVISWKLPAALALYWTTMNIVAIVQQLWIQRRLQLTADGKT